MKKIKRIVAGMVAAAISMVNLALPVSSEYESSLAYDDGGDESLELLTYDNELCCLVDKNGNPVLPKDHHSQLEEEEVGAVYYPSSYDTRDVFASKGLAFPEIKDQVSTGTCWAHAALAAVEGNGILNGVISDSNANFSEAHLAYFAYMGDTDTSSSLYNDYCKTDRPSSAKDYFGVYDEGGNMLLASSILARGSGPVFEIPSWDIAVNPSTYLILDRSSYPEIYDVIDASERLMGDYGWYYKKDGNTINLNGAPYSYVKNITTNLFYSPISESYRYKNDYKFIESENYAYNYDVNNKSSINNIKKAIMDNGVLTLSYYCVRPEFASEKEDYYFPMKAFAATFSSITENSSKAALKTNHAVSIIGWDDNYSRLNFGSNENVTYKDVIFTPEDRRPKSNGAWLCRNSWGDNYGNGGYFYISYEEPELRNIYSFEVTDKSEYGDKTYQYDGSISSGAYNMRRYDSEYTMANIFTADDYDEISAVSFYTYDENVDYKIRIYTGVENGKPLSGVLAGNVISGIIEHGGYHTIKLPSPVYIKKGERFSVVISAKDSSMYVDNKCNSNGNSFYWGTFNPTEDTQPYKLSDLSDEDICIKAHTTGVHKLPAPTGLRQVSNTVNSVNIAWDSMADAAGYLIKIKGTGANDQWQTVGNTAANSKTIYDLKRGTEYIVAVCAYDSDYVYSDYAELTVTTSNIAPDDININSTNFPDSTFRSYVSSNFDTDGNGYLSESERNAVTSINVSEKGISSLKGVEYFTKITYLNCSGNNLTTLDVSKNTVLTGLYCYNNNLTMLDVSKNTALTYLNCRSNNLTTLDVSKNTVLTRLYCYSNKLTTLDVSKNTALIYLDCDNNNLTTLDVSNNTVLDTLWCQSNNLPYVDITNNYQITTFIASGNKYNTG
ncbi:MAG: fibronectin type III domain-containing protein, partial [Oscillospiraceae bacterium]|nr:fibronectin type III domain-containing protein [Oscillospiraceae bacterium]